MAELRREAAAAAEEIRRSAENEERELVESARREATLSLTECPARNRRRSRNDADCARAETAKLVEEIVRNILKRHS